MSSFTKEPVLQQLPVSGKWKVMKGFTYCVGKKGSKIKVRVPRGFITDFASIPRPLRVFFSPSDVRWTKSAICHDYLYRSSLVSRIISDAVFMEAMTANKSNPTPLWIAHLFYWSVRLFGWKFCRKAV